MKMSELSDAVGVNSATIRYYIRQGLLPRPYKTHKNMAYYDERYIDRVLFIKKLQKEYFLPLDVIKDKIDESGCAVEPGMADEVVKRLSRDQQTPPLPVSRVAAGKKRLTREEFLDRTHLSRSDFEAALKVGFISQNEEGLIDAECLEIALLLAGLRKYLFPDQGLAVDFFTMYLKALEDLASKEINALLENYRDKGVSLKEVNEVVHKSANLFFQLAPVIHKRLLIRKIRDHSTGVYIYDYER